MLVAVLVVIHMLLAFTTIGLVLMHSGKDAGLSGAFGVGSGGGLGQADGLAEERGGLGGDGEVPERGGQPPAVGGGFLARGRVVLGRLAPLLRQPIGGGVLLAAVLAAGARWRNLAQPAGLAGGLVRQGTDGPTA